MLSLRQRVERSIDRRNAWNVLLQCICLWYLHDRPSSSFEPSSPLCLYLSHAMFFILACLFFARRYGTSAAPVAPSFADPLANYAPIFARDECSNDCSCPDRSVWDIVWSCLATTFAVTWVSVHPNVPFLEESSWTLLKRRTYLMCLALLAPEVLIMWAFKQWRGALMIRETINKARPKSCVQWTMTHAHFLQMGGFKVNYMEGPNFYCDWPFRYETIKEGIVVQESFLNLDDLQELIEKQLIDFPDTTAKEIEDRSKGDALSKGVALLQITWFITQLIVRAHQHLMITEIELTTAALAGLNSIVYLFWWSKPLDVRFPIVIRTRQLERVLVGKAKNTGGSSKNKSRNEGGSGRDMGHDCSRSAERWSFPEDEFRLRNYLRDCPFWVAQGIISALATHLLHTISILLRLLRRYRTGKVVKHDTDIQSTTYEPENSQGTKSHFRGAITWIWTTCMLIITKLLYLPYLLMFLPMDKILDPSPLLFDSDKYSDARDKMHSKPALLLLFNEYDMGWIMKMIFYSEDAETRPLLIFSALAGAVFGSIHCAAWHFDFPSSVEQILCRTASLSIVGMCLCIVGGIPIHEFLRNKSQKAGSGSDFNEYIFWKNVRKCLVMIPAIVYPFSRLSLLILALISLRNLPDPAFKTVTWTKFIPHI